MPESPIFPPTIEERVERLERLFKEFLAESGQHAAREGATHEALTERILQSLKNYGE